MGEFIGLNYKNLDESIAGTITDLYLYAGDLIPTVASLIPIHELQLDTNLATADERLSVCSGGVKTIPDVWTLTITDNSLETDDTDYITVGGHQLTYSSSAGAGKILIGANANETAANTAAAIATLSEVLTSVATTDTIVTTGAYAAALTFTKSSGLTEATLTHTTTYVAGTRATSTVTVMGDTFRLGTKNTLIIVATTPKGGDEIFIQYDTAADDDATAIATGMKLAAQATLKNTTMPTGSRAFSMLRASADDISTALEAIFGTTEATAFSATGAVLTISAGVPGSEVDIGNYTQVKTLIENSLPSPLPTVGSLNQPQYPGKGSGVYLGATKDFNVQLEPNQTSVDSDNQLPLLGVVNVGFKQSASFVHLQPLNPRMKSLISGILPISSSGGRDMEILAGRSNVATYGLVAVQNSKIAPGQANIWVLFKVRLSGGLTQNNAKTNAEGITYNVTPDAINQPGNPIGYKYSYRQAA